MYIAVLCVFFTGPQRRTQRFWGFRESHLETKPWLQIQDGQLGPVSFDGEEFAVRPCGPLGVESSDHLLLAFGAPRGCQTGQTVVVSFEGILSLRWLQGEAKGHQACGGLLGLSLGVA